MIRKLKISEVKFNSTIIFIRVYISFFVKEIINLKKEVRKLNKIVSHLLKKKSNK